MANKSRQTANLVSAQTGVAVTISGDPVVLGVGNTELVRVTGKGFVGLGTNNPTAKLTIDTSTSGDNSSVINFKVSGSSKVWYGVASSNNNIIGGSLLGDSVIRATSGNILFSTDSGGNDAQFSIRSSGNIGIGTTNPLSIVTIGSTVSQTQPFITISRKASGGYWGGIKWDDAGQSWSSINEDSNHTLRIRTGAAGTDRIMIHESGRIGFGTDPDLLSPTYTFHNTIPGSINTTVIFAKNQTDYSFVSMADTGTTTVPAVGARGNELTFWTNGAERMHIAHDGIVNIGAKTTDVKFYVYNNTAGQAIYAWTQGSGKYYAGLFQVSGGTNTQYAIYGYANTSSSYSSGGILGYSINSNIYGIIGYWSTAAYYGLYTNGVVYAASGFSSSDERLKDVHARIEGGVLDNLTSLVPVEYTWKENTEQGRGQEGVTQIGLIAQEVEVNFPHLISENHHTRIAGNNPETLNEQIGMCKSIEYGKLTCYLLVALKEAYDKIKVLEQHVGIAST